MKIFLVTLLTSLFAKQGSYVYLINKERAKYNYPKIYFDTDLKNTMEMYRELSGDEWFLSESKWERTIPPFNETLTKEGYFLNYYSSFLPEHRFLFNLKTDDIDRTIKLKLTQEDEFDFEKCSYTTFTNHYSCCKTKMCRDKAWRFYPKMIDPILRSIACIELKTTDVFCYGNRAVDYSTDRIIY